MFRSPKVLVILLIIVVAVLATLIVNRSPRITVSKETTVITEPLDDEGLPDFEAYFLKQGFEGVTPENNAAVLFWRAFWPHQLQVEYRELMQKAIGLDSAIDDEPGLVLLTDKSLLDRVASWVGDEYRSESNTDLDPQEIADYELVEFAEKAIDSAQRRPWTSDQLPPLAEWIEENQTQIGWIREASERPRLYSPPPNFLDDKRESLMDALLPMTQNLRQACRALNAEAMWHSGEGRAEEAWGNTLACFRLAQLISHNFSFVQRLVAIDIEGLACKQTAVVLHHGEPTAVLARQILRELDGLPALDPMVNALDVGQRSIYIDTALSFAMGRSQELGDLVNVLLSRSVDCDLILRDGNDFYDRAVEAASIPERIARDRRIAALYLELDQRSQSAEQRGSGLSLLLSKSKRSQVISDILLSLLTPAFQAALHAEDGALAMRELTKVAAALAVYRAEQGEYPETLEQLVPDVLPEMPIDLYSDEPLIYRKMEDGGYLLYSISQNGIDNGGTDVGGEIVAGEWVEEGMDVNLDEADLVLRVPIPAFELPKPRGEE